MAKQTMLRFGYPDSLVAETEHWAVLLRPDQVTARCLILACTEEARSLGQVSAALEAAVPAAYAPEKFNYLALMMVDPHVHFHVIPRYAGPVEVAGARIPEFGWPRQPDLAAAAELTQPQRAQILADLKAHWPGQAASPSHSWRDGPLPLPSREREGPAPKAWEGEGSTRTAPPPLRLLKGSLG